MKREAKPMTAGEALATYSALCSRSEQCEADLRAAMRRRGLPDGETDTVIARLREQGFIDEARYIHAFVHDRIAYNGWGTRKVRQQLRLKHFDDSLIDNAIAEAVDAREYRQALAALLQRRYREAAGREPRRRREAAIRTALSRGYEPDLVFETANSLFDDIDGYDSFDDGYDGCCCDDTGVD